MREPTIHIDQRERGFMYIKLGLAQLRFKMVYQFWHYNVVGL